MKDAKGYDFKSSISLLNCQGKEHPSQAQLTTQDMQWLKPENVKSQVRDRLNGRFRLLMNETLDANIKIEKLAAEPEAFIMHKSRNFLNKIMTQSDLSKKFIARDKHYARLKETGRAWTSQESVKDISSEFEQPKSNTNMIIEDMN